MVIYNNSSYDCSRHKVVTRQSRLVAILPLTLSRSLAVNVNESLTRTRPASEISALNCLERTLMPVTDSVGAIVRGDVSTTTENSDPVLDMYISLRRATPSLKSAVRVPTSSASAAAW